MVTERAIGIVGGMGPEATVELMRRLVAATPAADDAGHVRLLVDSNPKVPSRIAHLIEKTGPDPTPVLVDMAQGLVRQGAAALAMPCNTAHTYLPAIRDAVRVPVLDMARLSTAALAALDPRPGKVALLASPALRIVGLYDAPFAEAGLAPLYAEGEAEQALLAMIRAVKAGRPSARDRARYEAAVQGFAEAGADAFLIACTELSVIDRPRVGGLPLLDTLDALVDAILEAAGKMPGRR